MQIHYFQRYHSKENVDTSNTMLMLSRLYNYNADKFFSMINSLILGEDESPEITFVGLSNICYSEFKYSRSTSSGVFHPSGRMGKSL